MNLLHILRELFKPRPVDLVRVEYEAGWEFADDEIADGWIEGPSGLAAMLIQLEATAQIHSAWDQAYAKGVQDRLNQEIITLCQEARRCDTLLPTLLQPGSLSFSGIARLTVLITEGIDAGRKSQSSRCTGGKRT